MSDTDTGAGWAEMDFGADADAAATDLLQAPRKVEKISVSYSKASKQVIAPCRGALWFMLSVEVAVSMSQSDTQSVVYIMSQVAVGYINSAPHIRYKDNCMLAQ